MLGRVPQQPAGRPSGAVLGGRQRRLRASSHVDRIASGPPGVPPYNPALMAIYLDHAATTPLRPEALEAMLPYLGGAFGNPSSAHSFGRAARNALDEAHERLATALGGTAREIVVTSGGTEANNLAIKGAAWAGKAHGHRLVASAVEHHAVGHTMRHLEKFGFEVVEVPVDRYGRVDPDELDAAIDERTTLVSVMLANNEVGTSSRSARSPTDFALGAGSSSTSTRSRPRRRWTWTCSDLGADLVTISAHKFEGPKGVGALWVRRGTQLIAQLHGGSQERHRRAGTENVAGAVGMAVAYECACADRPTTAIRLRALRARLAAACLAVDGVELTGHPTERLPGLLSLAGPAPTASPSASRSTSTGSRPPPGPPARRDRPSRPTS